MLMTNKFKRTLRNAYKTLPVNDTLAQRQRDKNNIDKIQENGKIAIVFTSMDCDCVKSTGCTLIDASVLVLQQWEERFYDNLEGHGYFHIYSPSDVDDFEPSSRDLAMEAHENGHPHHVYM